MFKSLRSRVIATALGAVAVTSSIVILLLAAVIGPATKQRQVENLRTILAEAAQLQGDIAPEVMASMLTKPGISVVVTRSNVPHLDTGASVQDVTVREVHNAATNLILLEAWLPRSNSHIDISSVDVEVFGVVETLLLLGIPVLLISLAIIGLALRRATTIALKPLDEMTELAGKIAAGQEGGRLQVLDLETELGRTGVAFNSMLDSLESSLERARQAEARLRQLCADVAHELRSPLASIVASADNLMRAASGRNNRELAENTALSVVRDGQRAARIVGDLTLAAQLDVDELAERQLVLRPCDLVETLTDSAKQFGERSRVKLQMQDSVGTGVLKSLADPERLQQILSNLLDNANRFAETYIRVEFETNKKHNELVVRVIDDGPGVSKESHEVIFDRFVRLEKDRSRNSGGSGLGLHISRALAEAHGGTLLSLPAKKGGRFELRIPVKLT